MGAWPSRFYNPAYRDARPVECVSYNMIRGGSGGSGWPSSSAVDADSFMGRLRARTGRPFDLPTESQWEYAGRAGTTTALNSGKNLTAVLDCPNMSEAGRYYYNGGNGDDRNGDTSIGTAKVGSYPPSLWGLYDIHGNVYEWCLDWYGPYPGTVTDPVGYDQPTGYRVFRGGSWSDSWAASCRSAFRECDYPVYGYYFNGFRVALPVVGQ